MPQRFSICCKCFTIELYRVNRSVRRLVPDEYTSVLQFLTGQRKIQVFYCSWLVKEIHKCSAVPLGAEEYTSVLLFLRGIWTNRRSVVFHKETETHKFSVLHHNTKKDKVLCCSIYFSNVKFTFILVDNFRIVMFSRIRTNLLSSYYIVLFYLFLVFIVIRDAHQNT